VWRRVSDPARCAERDRRALVTTAGDEIQVVIPVVARQVLWDDDELSCG
jgi:hypothetical protein